MIPLDVFRDSLTVVSVPLQSELPVGLTPEIITPGHSKYEAILQGIPRQVLSVADSKIRCIFYNSVIICSNDVKLSRMRLRKLLYHFRQREVFLSEQDSQWFLFRYSLNYLLA